MNSLLFPFSFHSGMLAFVLPESKLPNAIFSKPQISETGIFETGICGWLQPGEVVRMLEGPHNDRSMTLWKIESLQSGAIGWTSVGMPNERNIAPLPLRPLCEGSQPSRLQLGYTASVAGVTVLPMSLLDRPLPLSEGSKNIETLFPGTKMKIINGPACSGGFGNGMTFWQVKLESNHEGWVIEADFARYWLDPLFVDRLADSN